MGHLTRTVPGPRTRGALAGIAATLLLLGSADALARVLGASTSPLTAVGLLVIRVLPTDLVKLAITLFGEADKIVLILTVGVAGLGIGGLLGGLLCTRPRIALLAFTAAEAVLVLLVGLRPEAGAVDLAASAAGSLLGALAFALLLGMVRRPGSGISPASTPATAHPDGFGRRGFFLLAGASAMVGAVGIAAGRTVVAVGRGAAETVRRFVLPAPAVSAPPVPAGAEVGVDGVAPFTTAQADLYRIDTALVPPSVDPDAWELRVDGLVEEPFTLTFQDLLEAQLEEHRITLRREVAEYEDSLAGLAETDAPLAPSAEAEAAILAIPRAAPGPADTAGRSVTPAPEAHGAPEAPEAPVGPAGTARAEDPPQPPMAEPVSLDALRASRRTWRMVAGTAAAAAVVAVAGLGGALLHVTGEQRELDESLAQSQEQLDRAEQLLTAPDVRTETVDMGDDAGMTVVSSMSEQMFQVRAHGAPSVPDDRVMQLWLIDDAGAHSVGFLADGAVTVDGSEFGSGALVGVTEEPAGGSQQPTSDPLAVVEL